MAETIKKYTCIICPKGCDITVYLKDGEIANIEGSTCKRGEAYARSEVISPMRTLTTTVYVRGGGMLPVRTDKPIPKGKLFKAMELLSSVSVDKGVKAGEVIVSDILGTGANVIAVSDAERQE